MQFRDVRTVRRNIGAQTFNIVTGKLQRRPHRIDFFFKVHTELYRSVSPSTKSILPSAAITSAIKVPSIIFGIACRLPKLGPRQ